MTLTTEKFDSILAAVLDPANVEVISATKNVIANSDKMIAAYTAAIMAEALSGSAILTQLLFAAIFESGRRAGTEEALQCMMGEGK